MYSTVYQLQCNNEFLTLRKTGDGEKGGGGVGVEGRNIVAKGIRKSGEFLIDS